MSGMILFEDFGFANLLPALYWRPLVDVRCGRSTLGGNIESTLHRTTTGLWTRAWMADIAHESSGLPVNGPISTGDFLVNARWCPHGSIDLPEAPAVGVCDNTIVFVACDEQLADNLGPEVFLDPDDESEALASLPRVEVDGRVIRYAWDLLTENTRRLALDLPASAVEKLGNVHATAALINEDRIRIASGATVGPFAVIDATNGPIVIEAGATVSAHACIFGPAHIGRDSKINPHAQIHGGSSIGPVCKIGGEIDACVFQGYTNKQHDGFLGHSFVGSWVNLGASTINSDLKNTYGKVRMSVNGELTETDQTFLGCVIGDHSKTAIGTRIPTGCVIGFGVTTSFSQLLPHFVRSFTWLTDQMMDEGDSDRLLKTAETVMARRKVPMTAAMKTLFSKLPQIVAFFEPAIQPKRPLSEAPTPNRGEPPIAQPQGPV